MRAATYAKYGSPDVIEIRDIDRPVPGPNEVLIRVLAASVNPLDWHMLRGTPRFLRLTEGLFRPKHPVLGADVAGVVEEVGSGVTDLTIGDEVFGEIGHGAIAEFARCPARCAARKPAGLSWEAVAAVPVAALTALQGLRDIGHIQGGMKVLVNGASGGVGTFAVQIAKWYGAEVTGVCSTGNLDLVRRAGADHAIDYTIADFTRDDARYDLIFDAVGNRRYTMEQTADAIGYLETRRARGKVIVTVDRTA